MKSKVFIFGLLSLILVFFLVGCDLFDSPEPPPAAPASWTAASDGVSNVTTSTKITLEFNKAVTLEADNITLTNDIGEVTKGSLTKEGEDDRKWVLAITVNKQGSVKIKIEADGVENTEKPVTVYKQVEVQEPDPDPDIIDELALTISNVTSITGSVSIYLYKNFPAVFPSTPNALLAQSYYDAKAEATVEEEELVFELEEIEVGSYSVLMVNGTGASAEYHFYTNNTNVTSLPRDTRQFTIDEEEESILFNRFRLVAWPFSVVVDGDTEDLSEAVLYVFADIDDDPVAVSGTVTKASSDNIFTFVLMTPDTNNAASSNYWIDNAAGDFYIMISVDEEDEVWLLDEDGDQKAVKFIDNKVDGLDFEDFGEFEE